MVVRSLRNQTSLLPIGRRLAFRVRGGDAGGYETNGSEFLAQISTPMTAILDGRNSWVSRARVGSNYTVNTA